MLSNSHGIILVGTGNFAKHSGELLIQYDINLCGFIDRARTGTLLDRPIYSPQTAFKLFANGLGVYKVLVAISDNEVSANVRSELIELGFPPSLVVELIDDNTLTLIESLILLDKPTFLQALPSCTSLFKLERNLLGAQWQNAIDRFDEDKPVIGIGLYGKGGGFSSHLSRIFESYSHRFNIVYLTDDVTVYRSIDHQPKLLISNTSAQKYINMDIAISAHFIPFSQPSTIKLTFMHVIYDFCLAKNYVASCINSSRENHIFIPSSPCQQWFLELKKQNLITSQMHLHLTGYPKLDDNRKKFKCFKGSVDAIIYAPTLSSVKATHHELSYSMFYGEKIIKTLLANCPAYKIIFRPHPTDAIVLAKSKEGVINEQYHRILKLVDNEERLSLDVSSDYIESYARSALMVSDTSSTAFTFAFSTSRPVVFYCPRNDELVKTFKSTSQYINDRDRIGIIATSTSQLKSAVLSCLDSGVHFQDAIDTLRNNRIFHVDDSALYLKKAIDAIVQEATVPEV